MLLLFVPALANNFSQAIYIDTSLTLLQNSPFYSEEEAEAVHIEFEAEMEKGSLDLDKYFYLIFRYRDPLFIPIWKTVLKKRPKSEIIAPLKVKSKLPIFV